MVREATEPYRYLTAEEYFAWSDGSDTRYELVEGLLYAQAATSKAHGALVLELGGWLRAAARAAGCRTYTGVGVQVSHSTVYIPDIVVACGPDDDTASSITNPTVIAEVLSPTTERIDRVEKLAAYRRLDSLLAYLIVHQDARRIERHWRDEPESPWHSLIYTGGSVPLPLDGVELALDTLYAGIVPASAE